MNTATATQTATQTATYRFEGNGPAPTDHEFRPSGCRNQWVANHDSAHCYEAFLAHQAKATR